MRHLLLDNNKVYLEQLSRRMSISTDLVEETVSCFEGEMLPRKGELVDRLSSLVSLLTDVEAKYRIASRLGLRKLVGDLLSSPGLPYLKDTAWKTANFN